MRYIGLLPRVEFTDIEACFVHGFSFTTGEEIKAYKFMKACNFFYKGVDGKRTVFKR